MKKFVSLSLMLSLGLAIISPALNAAQSPAATAKQKAMARFNTSLNRFKKCYQNPKSCSRMDALKIARDLGIAAVALVTAAYVTGEALKGIAGPHDPANRSPIKTAVRQTGEALQTPGALVVNPLRIQRLISSGKIPPIGQKIDSNRVENFVNLTSTDIDSAVQRYDIKPMGLFKDDSVVAELENGLIVRAPLPDLNTWYLVTR